ncbi:MAG: YraN family protein [Syntrophales bacterium]|nr:YraN family protein [Syntrophales bacterium]
MACRHLKEMGYSILERSYRCLFGEIDIIARDGQELVFVEVKSRKTPAYGNPEVSVDRKKQRKLSLVALHYLSAKRLHDTEARFDVVAIEIYAEKRHIIHIPNAFDLAP